MEKIITRKGYLKDLRKQAYIVEKVLNEKTNVDLDIVMQVSFLLGQIQASKHFRKESRHATR